MRLIELALKYEMVIGWNLNESVIDLGNGWLTESITEADIKPFATSVSELNGYLKRLQIDFLYVQCPYVICKYDDIESDFSNENVDSFLYMLSISNIPYLDLREYIHKENLNHHDLFYKTESHWKIETGLWAAKIVGKHLKTYNVFDFDEGMFNPKLYQSDVYESWLLGNWGRKVTLVRTQPEDFTLIYPTFQTNFLLQIPTRNIDKRGTFDVFYDYDRIKTKDYYHLSPYGAFCYERNPLVIINNELTNNGKKVLCIVDSYGRIVVPFLAHGIESAEMIDLRSFDGSLKSYIEQSDPDVVLVLYNPTVFNKYENYDNLFDFR
jgi:hypothetical protein